MDFVLYKVPIHRYYNAEKQVYSTRYIKLIFHKISGYVNINEYNRTDEMKSDYRKFKYSRKFDALCSQNPDFFNELTQPLCKIGSKYMDFIHPLLFLVYITTSNSSVYIHVARVFCSFFYKSHDRRKLFHEYLPKSNRPLHGFMTSRKDFLINYGDFLDEDFGGMYCIFSALY